MKIRKSGVKCAVGIFLILCCALFFSQSIYAYSGYTYATVASWFSETKTTNTLTNLSGIDMLSKCTQGNVKTFGLWNMVMR